MRTCGGGGARGRGISSAIKPGAGTLRKSASRQSRVGSCSGSEGTSRGSIDGVFGKAGQRVWLAMRIRRMSTRQAVFGRDADDERGERRDHAAAAAGVHALAADVDGRVGGGPFS